MRAYFYVDAFNLYYGCLKGTPFKWLDIPALCERLLPRDTVERVHYFTAKVRPLPHKPGTDVRQEIYIRALQTDPRVAVHFGHFLTHPRLLPLASPPPSGPRRVKVLVTEEKGSDVNLATRLLADAFSNAFELGVVISNDSDLAEPIRYVASTMQRPIHVFHPHSQPSQQLRQVATRFRKLRLGPISASQFLPVLTDARGTIAKPPTW
ncbi:MAG: NYN domain-containing protein [Deltaproteobacteria bacterium]|nr:NYN domain-containing protein [Deltaproteobacteria bacterium]